MAVDPQTITALAQSSFAALQPVLPWLAAKAAEGVAGEAGKKLFGTVAEKIWRHISPRIQARPEAESALQDFLVDPGDADAQAALRLQIRKLLADDPSLATEVARILEGAKRTDGTVRGDRSVAVGGDAISSPITTGDSNIVQVSRTEEIPPS